MMIKKVPTLAYLGMLSLLMALGFWQLNRAEQKKVFFEQQKQGLVSAKVLVLSDIIAEGGEALRYTKVQVLGHYDVEHQFLLDNQMHEGQVGYCVLTPFVLAGQTKAVLVNRGWIPLNKDRSVLPVLKIESAQAERVELHGRINHFPSVGIKLAGAEIPTVGWPSVLQVVDTDVLAKKLAQSLFSFQVELDSAEPNGYVRDWQTTTVMLPEQHVAYAIQWFALAATLTVLFFGYSCKKNDK